MTSVEGLDTLRAVPPTSPFTEILLSGLRFHVRVGILAHEREVPQPLEVDLAVRHTAAPRILDYRALYESAQRVVAQEPLDYLERVAEDIAEQLLALGDVSWCRVAVRKPHVALGGPLAFAQVSVERSRG